MTKRSTLLTAARESSRRLEGCFGEGLWKVASEPECWMEGALQFFGRQLSRCSRPIPVSGSDLKGYPTAGGGRWILDRSHIRRPESQLENRWVRNQGGTAHDAPFAVTGSAEGFLYGKFLWIFHMTKSNDRTAPGEKATKNCEEVRTKKN